MQTNYLGQLNFRELGPLIKSKTATCFSTFLYYFDIINLITFLSITISQNLFEGLSTIKTSTQGLKHTFW